MNKRKKGVQIGLGTSSILMIFVILCMMILSVLSYTRALQNEKSAKREVEYHEAYQKANSKGEMVYLWLKAHLEDKDLTALLKEQELQKLMQGMKYEVKDNNIFISINVNKRQTLFIQLEKTANDIIQRSWKLVSKGGQTS